MHLNSSSFFLQVSFFADFFIYTRILLSQQNFGSPWKDTPKPIYSSLTLQCIECLQNAMENCSSCCHWHTALPPLTLSQWKQGHSLVARTSNTATHFEQEEQRLKSIQYFLKYYLNPSFQLLSDAMFPAAAVPPLLNSANTANDVFVCCTLHMILGKHFLKFPDLPCLSWKKFCMLKSIMNFTFSVFRKHTGVSGSRTSFSHVFEASPKSSFNFFRLGKLTVAFDTFSEPHSNLPSYTSMLLNDIILLKI